MATRKVKVDVKDLAPAKPAITSLVKKDMKQIKDYAASINKALKDPSIAAIRVCECCVQVS